ncbi:hypothetical protein M422DRAFT_253427 [Sphaerobolus stellatus SS14]|uniref:Uncharacterized protein n=1 Tax=Sphaerobolus stellatus (strain SS14) TaxID=990650 RepID=A0A0C9UJJ0_SPHS4|nr:hypothetical protein M422DRAFT_253427 [Sphaerobolus stellatus SS14]
MSLKVGRRITFWKKPSSNNESNDIREDWMEDSMKVANLTIIAGDAVPGVRGVIKAAAGMFIALLQPVQQMGKNKEDCRILITSVAQLLQAVNKELKTGSSFENINTHI